MKLMLVPALLLAAFTGPTAAVRFEADGVRVGGELVTGAAVNLKEAGALPLLVSGSVVESLSGESLTVSLGEKSVVLGAGLRLSRTAAGFKLSTHGLAFTVEAGPVSLAGDREATFTLTEKGFDFGALGVLEGSTFAAKVGGAALAAVAEPQEVQVSPEKPVRQGRQRTIRRLYAFDPLNAGNAAGTISVRQIGRVSPDGAP